MPPHTKQNNERKCENEEGEQGEGEGGNADRDDDSDNDMKKIADVRKELSNGFEVDVNDIGKISLEADEILKKADEKISLLIEKVQDRIVEMEDEYRKRVAEIAKEADKLAHGCASTKEAEK